MPEPTPAEPASTMATRPDHHGLGVEHPDQKPAKPRRPLRWVMRAAAVLLAVLLVLTAAGPWLLSTGPGTRWLVSQVNPRVGGEIRVEDLSLSWGAGQSITGLTYTDAANGITADVALIDAPSIGLFDVLVGGRELGEITLRGTEVVVVPAGPSGPSTAPKDDRPRDGAPRPGLALPATLSGSIRADGLTVAYHAPGLEPVVVTLPEGSVDVPDLRDITLDLDATLRQGTREGEVVVKGGVLNLFDPDGVEQRMKAAYDLEASVSGLSAGALDQVVSGMTGAVEPGLIAALLGGGDLAVEAEVKGTIEQLKSELDFKSANAHINIIQEREGGSLVASPRSFARLDLEKGGDAFAALFPDSGLALVEDTAIKLTSFAFKLPTTDEGIDWEKASASMQLRADANLALKDEKGEVIGVDALTVTGVAESIAKQARFEVSATLSAVDERGNVTREPVGAQLEVDRPMDGDRELVFFSDKLPIALADALLGLDDQPDSSSYKSLVLWLGRTLEMHAQLRGRVGTDASGVNRVTRSFTLEPNGRVSGRVDGERDAQRLTLATPEKRPIEATLVPEAFASMMELLSGRPGQPVLTIDRPMRVYVTLRDDERGALTIATDPNKKGVKRFYPDPDRTALAVTIELSPARVTDPKNNQLYDLRSGRLTLRAPDLRGKAQIGAELNLQVAADAGKAGVASLLTWQTTVTDLLAADGGLPLDGGALMGQLSLNGGVRLQNAPSGLFDALLNREGDLASVLGPVVEQMDAGFTYADGRPTAATLKLNWDDANGRPLPGASASLRPVVFDVDADRVLSVRGGKDIELEVRVTEAFGDRWMGRLHPVLFDARSGDRPVRVTIDGASFRFPLDDPAMRGAVVHAEVDLGSIAFGEGSLLSRLTGWAGRPGERAVFEPAAVSLVDGRIRYDRLDLAVGNIRLRLDGEVDLASGQIVDMAVRVPGQSLIDVFRELDGLIPPDDELSIPMSGPIRKPSFDRQLITREVARLVAAGLIQRQRGGLGDKLFGKIREELGVPPEVNPPEVNPQVPPDAGALDVEPIAGPKRIEDALRDELIERGLGLILGGRRGAGPEEQQ